MLSDSVIPRHNARVRTLKQTVALAGFLVLVAAQVAATQSAPPLTPELQREFLLTAKTVSYTHLTLPTILRV